MNVRERILAILERQPVDRIPVDLWHTPEILATLKGHFGVQDDLVLYRTMKLDKIVWVFLDYMGAGEGESFAAQDGTKGTGARTAWGAPIKEMDTGLAVYQEIAQPPLLDYESIESLDDYPYWPDPNRFDYESAVKLAKEASKEFVTLGPWVSFYEIYCQLRGIEQSLMDLLVAPDYVQAALEKIEAIQTEVLKQFLGRAAQYMDMVFISDDMGMQQNMLCSLDMWDCFFKDRLKSWCDLIHSHGLKVFYHSDGAVEPLIDRLIEAGIDVLNPIQHACKGMDCEHIKRQYGERVIFHGGIDNQSVLPVGTIDDVRKETQMCLDTLGRGRQGYICCSCHNVQPGTPLENIFAMIETVHNSIL